MSKEKQRIPVSPEYRRKLGIFGHKPSRKRRN